MEIFLSYNHNKVSRKLNMIPGSFVLTLKQTNFMKIQLTVVVWSVISMPLNVDWPEGTDFFLLTGKGWAGVVRWRGEGDVNRFDFTERLATLGLGYHRAGGLQTAFN